MKRYLMILLAIIYTQGTYATTPKTTEYCTNTHALFKKPCKVLHQIWYEGQNELYVPAYAWHNRYYYTADKIGSYNENPWGIGLGKRFYDADGDWHALYAFGFLDSHKNVEPIVGYAFAKMLHFDDNAAVGLGYAVLVTSRPDILHSVPFPGVLPWLTASYQRASVAFIYIPGRHNVGNVLFFLVKWVLN